MDRDTLANIVSVGGKLVSGFLRTYLVPRSVAPLAVSEEKPEEKPKEVHIHLSASEIISYQRRELSKELLLLQGHLEQGCKINSKACDCCEKHPIKIEGLAQETISMTTDPVFKQVADWAQEIAPVTTEAASASGKYDGEYPKLAIQARDFRKAIMPDSFNNQKEVEHGEISTVEE